MPPDKQTATVKPGSTVRIRENDGPERIVRIRGDASENWAADSVAAGAPLARALFGRRPGDVVEVQVHPVLPIRSVVILAVE